MREAARDWIDRAQLDLAACRKLRQETDLTPVVAFHAQQCIEKIFKGLLEDRHLPVPRTHKLIRLHDQVKAFLPIALDERILEELSAVYIESRYPSELGLLPKGRPSTEDVRSYCDLCEQLFAIANRGYT